MNEIQDARIVQIGRWRIAQIAFFLVGLTILLALFFAPSLGLTLLWDVLIPVAPALIVLAPGVWRNVCPLATTSLVPQRRLSPRPRPSLTLQGWLQFGGLALLLVLVPLRHPWFNVDALASAFLLLGAVVLAVVMTSTFSRKSGWCNGLCPVGAVERLYGQRPAVGGENAQCDTCTHCTGPCPESVHDLNPVQKGSPMRRITGYLCAGLFPGFVWGWFQVPDATAAVDLAFLVDSYTPCLLGALVTGAAFALAFAVIPNAAHRIPVLASAALSVGVYYWYRIPWLLGHGEFPGNGTLVDLHASLSPATAQAIGAGIGIALAVWILVSRRPRERSWTQRPPVVMD